MLEFESFDYLFYNSGIGYNSASSSSVNYRRCNAATSSSSWSDYMLSADENGFYFTSNSGYNSSSANYGMNYYKKVYRYNIGDSFDSLQFEDYSGTEVFMYQGMFCSADASMSSNADWYENKIICHEGGSVLIRLDNDEQYNLEIERMSNSGEYYQGPAIIGNKLFLQCGDNFNQLCVVDLVIETILS
tara:strand:- start:125 stop:688 length:564 start_codon:yes stop_codon:yes gene_type:complete